MQILINNKSLSSVLIGILLFSGCQSKPVIEHSDILWNIISQQCLPGQKENARPAPCEEVSFSNSGKSGYVILKDRNGPLQYLLMPTEKITGIESPQILRQDSPNYFYQAWKSRSYMVKKYQAPIPDEEISLAINSEKGRTQNQLHIHISCIRTDVRDLVHRNLSSLGNSWSPFPGGILHHAYFARRVSEEQLKQKSAFAFLAEELPGAKENMGQFGLAIVPVKNKKSLEFVLLADRADVLKLDRASAEEVQDHRCPQLYDVK